MVRREKRKRRYVQEVEYSVWVVPRWMTYIGWFVILGTFIGVYLPIYFHIRLTQALIYIELILGAAGLLIGFYLIERLEAEK